MRLGPPIKLTCPYCGSKKYIESLSSGNTIGGIVWSDTKHEYPMLQEPSPIQKCTSCCNYYFYEDSQPQSLLRRLLNRFDDYMQSLFDELEESEESVEEIDDDEEMLSPQKERMIHIDLLNNGFGGLSFEEMDAAYDSLYSDDLSQERKKVLLYMWLYAFNDKYNGRKNKSDCSNVSSQLLNKQQSVILEIVSETNVSKVVYSELLREAGLFRESIAMIGDLTSLSDIEAVYACQILEHARMGDRGVFRINSK